RGVYLDFAAALQRDGRAVIEEKYGNLFDMYRRITGEDGYARPMRIYPALHYTMGGLWVNYELMTTVDGLFCIGEANFSDHGANVTVPGSGADRNVALERAGRVADFLEFGDLLARDAATRHESCGGHFREEYQYPDGEAKRDDDHFAHVAAWEYAGDDAAPVRHEEPLVWESVKPSVRSYK